ncbi:MAG: hypothetical protein WBP81_12375 [Solirubrobacteraceae bacterium]
MHRVRDVHGVGVDGERARALVPARRLAELARYGLAANAPRLRRHPTARRIATLVATVAHLQATSIDDCLELFDLIMTTELLGKAERETNKQRAREHPRLARASAKLARVVGKLLEASGSEEMVRVSDLWREIETVASREELRLAVATVVELVPHSDEDDEGVVRARVSERIRMVSGFARELCEVIELGSNADGEPVLREMRRMPWLLDRRRTLTAQAGRGDAPADWAAGGDRRGDVLAAGVRRGVHIGLRRPQPA